MKRTPLKRISESRLAQMKDGSFKAKARKPLNKKSKRVSKNSNLDGSYYTSFKGYNFAVKKRSLPTISDVRHDLWKIVADTIKERDGDLCVSCGQQCEGYNRQAGHFEPKAACGALLYYHPHNIHTQCGYCNSLEGNRTKYFPAMEKKYGREYTDKLISLKDYTKQNSIQADTLFYEWIRVMYSSGRLEELANKLNNYDRNYVLS